MKRRALGLTELSVSEIGLGCSELGRPLVHRNRADWLRLLHRAFDLGINFYDTADVYRYGMSERLLGQAFRDRRDSVVISTKVGILSSPLVGMLETLPTPLQHLRRGLNNLRPTKPGAGTCRKDFSPTALYGAVLASLRRLGTDRIDLLLLHEPPNEVLERDDSLRVLELLVEEGKVRSLGVSAGSLDVARRAVMLPWISVLQVPYSVLDQEVGASVIAAAAEKEVGIIARLVLARGLLTPKRALATGPRSLGKKDPTALAEITDALAYVAEEGGRTLTEVAILFALANPGVSCALIGTTQFSHLEVAVAALEERPLSDQELRQIGRVTRTPGPEPT